MNRIKGNEGDKYMIEDVSLLSDGDKVEVGKPSLENVKIETVIKKHFKGDKVIAFKYKPKKRYRRKVGHRQQLTLLSLEKISIK